MEYPCFSSSFRRRCISPRLSSASEKNSRDTVPSGCCISCMSTSPRCVNVGDFHTERLQLVVNEPHLFEILFCGLGVLVYDAHQGRVQLLGAHEERLAQLVHLDGWRVLRKHQQ